MRHLAAHDYDMPIVNLSPHAPPPPGPTRLSLAAQYDNGLVLSPHGIGIITVVVRNVGPDIASNVVITAELAG